jgi:hypothetical protein
MEWFVRSIADLGLEIFASSRVCLVQLRLSGAFFRCEMIQQSTGLVCFRFFWVHFDNSHGFYGKNYCSLSGGFRGGRRNAASRSESVQSEEDLIPIQQVWNERKSSKLTNEFFLLILNSVDSSLFNSSVVCLQPNSN